MLRLLRQHRRLFVGTALAGLGLRLLFFFYYPAITDDSRIYADFATNWLQHGVYGTTQLDQIVPADTRLPGYPAFLAVLFALFGAGSFRAVMGVQIVLDLGTCLILADLARRTVSDRAARIAFVLAALCPFLANYAAAALTETLEVFFTVLAFDLAVSGFDQLHEDRFRCQIWAGVGLAIAACILLRPDGGLVLAALCLYLAFWGWRRRRQHSAFINMLRAGTVVVLFTLIPLAPWTIRNLHTLHHFQPLAPRYANAQDELPAMGFNRWIRTWVADYASVEEIYWNVPGDKIDPDKLPARAFDNPSQQDATEALLDDYNASQAMTPELDARFADLAAQRVHEHPMRYYVRLPLLRIADMWLRPRTELLPPDVRWWEFDDDPKGSVMAVTLGLLNLAYVGVAVVAMVWRFGGVRYAGLLVGFLLLRSAFLGTLENPEPRYTLECYPVVILFAAVIISSRWSRSKQIPQVA